MSNPLDARTPVEYGNFEYYEYIPEGAVIRTFVKIYKDIHHLQRPLASYDTFFNPQKDFQMLQKMERMSTFECAVWYEGDEDFRYQKTLRWTEQNRQSVRILLLRSRGKQTIWPAAKERCMRENPM